MTTKIKVLDHGYVTLRNLAGPTRRAVCTDYDNEELEYLVEIDFDADDIDPANSARMSYDESDDPDRTREDDLKLCEYLLKNRHTTPWEMIEGWFEMKMPIFVARQLVRHRTVSINEMSARYIQLKSEFYIPEIENVGIKAGKQGRGEAINENDATGFCTDLENHCDNAYVIYKNYLDMGVAPELARMVLPLNIYTKWLWKQNLHNLMHMMGLRIEGHAQWEVQQYAQAVYELLKVQLPNSMELFDKYRRKS